MTMLLNPYSYLSETPSKKTLNITQKETRGKNLSHSHKSYLELHAIVRNSGIPVQPNTLNHNKKLILSENFANFTMQSFSLFLCDHHLACENPYPLRLVLQRY